MENLTVLCYISPMEYGITFQERGQDIHYFITWSKLSKADRWEINAKVPSVAGIYEIYWMDDHEHLRMLSVGCTHFGGLRTELRRLTDPELVDDQAAKKTLSEEEIWYRYSPTSSVTAMADIVWFFRKTYFPENPGVSHSGKYEKIFINESAPDKLIWVP
jgi:hypothetical protein